MMKLVAVDWDDANAGSSWKSIDHIKAQNKPSACRTIGWLVAESRSAITVVSNIDTDTNHGTGEMCIPRAAVKRIRKFPDPWRKK